jgi:hypothetical protein
VKKQYPLALAVAAAGVLIGSLFLTGNFLGTAGQSSGSPSTDHSPDSNMPLDVKYVSKDRERGLDAIGSHYLYIDENFVDDENHCEFCIFAQYKPGTFGRAVYAFENKSPMDLSEAKTLRFLARGELGGETIKIYSAGRKASTASDSDQSSIDDGLKGVEFGFSRQLTLSTEWVKYEIDLAGLDLSEISHSFAFEMIKDDRIADQIVYLDLIYYDTEKSDFATALN